MRCSLILSVIGLLLVHCKTHHIIPKNSKPQKLIVYKFNFLCFLQKFELAKRQLFSGKAKLRKQQTLENVLNRTEIIDEQQREKLDVEYG